MKQWTASGVATLAYLCALCAHAEMMPCTDARSCAPASVIAPMGNGVLAIPPPPPPSVAQAPNDEIDLSALGNSDVTVELTYPEIADGDTAGLYWTSPLQQYRARVQTVSGGAKRLIFTVPNATVIKDAGLSPILTASVGVNNGPLVISQPRKIRVINTPPVTQYKPPVLTDFQNERVDIGTLAGDLKVRVEYDGMAAGQTVKLLWRGATSYETPPQLLPDTTPLDFTIPHATVIASLGKPVTLNYDVTLNGQAAQPSAGLQPSIVLSTLKDVPVIPVARQGQVDLKDLAGQPLKITYSYTGIAPGHRVGLRWAGNPVYDTPHPPIGATPRPLEFTIPYDKVRQEKDKTVLISASVGVDNGRLVISPTLSVKVVASLSKGEEAANDLNTRYNDVRASCQNNQPAYYCSGVTLRSTVHGNYDPWDPSPSGVKVGGVSFSYMRKDTYITDFLYSSGFLLLDQEHALSENKALTYLCIYAYDSYTLHGNTNKGCGFKPRAVDASSCASAGVRTATQWYNYTERLSHQMYQCSLSTTDAAQFYTSIQVRARKPVLPTPVGYGYNELMIGTWPQNSGKQLPIQAFFYKANAPAGNTATALAEAKIYQSKYMTRTSIWVPVIKIDFSHVKDNPFSYNPADQAVQP